LAVPEKVKHRINSWPSNSIARYTLKRNEAGRVAQVIKSPAWQAWDPAFKTPMPPKKKEREKKKWKHEFTQRLVHDFS
jgi:hypothetical protein